MPQVRMKDADPKRSKLLSVSMNEFVWRCRLKNLPESTIEYYRGNFQHFRRIMADIQDQVHCFAEYCKECIRIQNNQADTMCWSGRWLSGIWSM